MKTPEEVAKELYPLDDNPMSFALRRVVIEAIKYDREQRITIPEDHLLKP